jgi:hypothetical protein
MRASKKAVSRTTGLLDRHKDPVASVTTVLSRLVAYDKVRSLLKGGRCVWECVAGRDDSNVLRRFWQEPCVPGWNDWKAPSKCLRRHAVVVCRPFPISHVEAHSS